MTILILSSKIPGTQLRVAYNQLWSESQYIMCREIKAVTGSSHVDSCSHTSDRTNKQTNKTNKQKKREREEEEEGGKKRKLKKLK